MASLGLAVVMPEVGRSFYTDMAAGSKYWTFISEELPEIARKFFGLSERREENFAAGLSMGGYGAFTGSNNDLFALVTRLADSGKPQPKLYQWCGTEDFLYEGNIKFRKYAQKLKLDLTYEESPGDHQWIYWDQQIQRVLEWLPL